MRRVHAGLLLAAVLLSSSCLAQWSPLRPISQSDLPSRLRYNFGWAIAIDGAGVVHAAWLEETSSDPPGLGTGRVMYSRSPDDGRHWSTPAALSGAPEVFTGHPRVAAAGPHIYIVWHGTHDHSGTSKIYLLHSPDHGSTWDAGRIVSDNTPQTVGAGWPSANACGESVHVVWSDSRTGAAEIYLRSSADAGATWTPVREVSVPDGRSSWVPTVACWGATVHVAWADERHNVDESEQPYDCGLAGNAASCREEEYYRRSTDFGASWEPEIRLTADAEAPRPSWAPSIAAWGNNVHVVFFDHRTDRFEIYHKRSTGGGAAHTWEPEQSISAGAGNATTMHARPVIAARDRLLHVVWFAVTPDQGVDVLFTGSPDNGTTFATPVPLTPHSLKVEAHPSLAMSPRGSTHLIWYMPDAHGVDQIVHRALRSPRRRDPREPWD